MKKVVVFYPYNTGKMPFSGGVAKVAVSNIIACHLNGYKPYLILPAGNSGLIQFVKSNYPYCEVKPVPFNALALFSQTKNKWKRLKLFLNNTIQHISGKQELKKILEEIQPDVIHYHETVCYDLLKLYTKCKVVIHIHAYEFVKNRIVRKAVLHSINKYADTVIAPTNSIQESRSKDIFKPIVKVRTPYLNLSNTEKALDKKLHDLLLEQKKSHIIFGYVGRICRIKRIDNFLQALVLLPDEKKSLVKYVIIGGCNTIGDEDYKKELEHFINKNDLGRNVDFVGYVDPIEAILPFIDYGAMLTKSEAMPMVGIEYLRFNIPTLGYDVPGINDYVIDGVDGFLVKDGDVNDLANGICRALDTPPGSFRDNIENIFKDYSVEKFAEALKEVYFN